MGDDNFEHDNDSKIEQSYIYKIFNDLYEDERLNDNDVENLLNIQNNQEDDHHNNSNNGNNNNLSITKTEENDIERQTLENKESDTTNKKETDCQSEDSQKFSGSYQEYLDNEKLYENMSQKSTNSSEKKSH